MSPEEKLYLDWRKGTQIGCFFARMIANHPPRYGHKIETVVFTGNHAQAATEIAVKIDSLIADKSTNTATVLITGINSLEDIARTFLAIHNPPDWVVNTTDLQNTPAGPMVAVHVNKTIPFGAATCPSEGLVLGPFGEFPPTRRSPVVAFELYVGDPRPFDPKTGLIPTTKANLAHVEMNFPTHHAFQKTWDRSVDGRTASLGNNGIDSRAKAKVAFVIPPALAQQLGCAP